MGMSSRGEIARLVEMARPCLGVITNIGEAHLELLGSQESIAMAKEELLEGLVGRRLAVLNGDDPWQRQMAENHQGDVILYGFGGNNHFQAEEAVSLSWGVEFRIKGKPGRYRVPLPGRHSIYNGLAAASVGFSLSLDPDQIRAGLEKPELTGMRMEKVMLPGQGLLINDAYNANPGSMEAALSTLHDFPPPRVAVLGDMLELGPIADQAHRRIGREAVLQGVDYLLLLGDMAPLYREGAVAAGMPPERVLIEKSHEDLVDKLLSLDILDKATVLLKGSRGAALEKVAEGILACLGRGDKIR